MIENRWYNYIRRDIIHYQGTNRIKKENYNTQLCTMFVFVYIDVKSSDQLNEPFPKWILYIMDSFKMLKNVVIITLTTDYVIIPINIYCIITFIWSNTVIHYKHKYYSRCVVSATFLCNAFVAFGMQFSQDLNNVLKVCSEHLLVSTKTLMKGFTCTLMRSPSY